MTLQNSGVALHIKFLSQDSIINISKPVTLCVTQEKPTLNLLQKLPVGLRTTLVGEVNCGV